MFFKKVKKDFKLVALKGSGEFVHYGYAVPLLAKELLNRSEEILHSTETEISLYEPKKNKEHKVGTFYAGLIVSEQLSETPPGMEYMEISKSYITIRGNMSKVAELHSQLLNWAAEQGHQLDLDAFIIETYHPVGDGEEEVEIYLPIQV
ncbi:MAG: GyrI-like domain-containing protein [Cytobacillus gottheilii]|uniref:GyrI-like domain-containing protein n=1 Tax=Cytobacillus gottheilii TaxID=859144 RepID=UPI000836FAC9|nr:GyrI-like domain-containing protein [Cytobacillus gottheilii]